MKRRIFGSTALWILLLVFPIRLWAWGATGHRVIAQIAEDNISPRTRAKINRLLNDYPMAYWANWADNIRSDTTGKWKPTYEWHYVDLEGGLSKSDFVSKIKAIERGNVYSAILKLSAEMKDKRTSDSQRKTDLYFIIHLVGDMHQPFHIGHPEDLGGNKIKVFWFGRPTNIHAVWDSELIDSQKYSYTEYASILNTLSSAEKLRLQQGGLEDWLYETYLITGKLYEDIHEEDKLSYAYSYKYIPIVESQLQKAGLRLAKILDEIFK